MSDVLEVITADGEIASGEGYLMGVHISVTSVAQVVTFYDNTAASGTKIFETYVNSGAPVTIFFPTRFAPHFSTGLYVDMGANCTVVAWTREYSGTS
jgi:hypothetical protein